MSRLLRCALLGLLIHAGLADGHADAPFTALRDGEHFRFQIAWGIFSNAGEIVMNARRDTTAESDLVRIQTRISSRGFIRGLYKFDNVSALVIDQATGRLLTATEEGTGGSQGSHSLTVFDYDKRVASHRDSFRPNRDREFPLGVTNPVDLITALIQTRNWNLKVGDHRSVDVYFGRDIYPVVIHAERIETVKTPLGTFATTVLVPRMETEAPRGIFQRGGEIKVWVSDGDDPEPVQMQLQLNFGRARLMLVEHSLVSPVAGNPVGSR